jgi:hypothetical protein
MQSARREIPMVEKTRQQIVCDAWRVAKHYWNLVQRSAAAVGDDEWEWYVILTLWSPLAVSEEDLAANGYRWVSVDGPYGCPSKNDLRQITKHRPWKKRQRCQPGGIITRRTRYNIYESGFFMKWHCCFGFSVPAGLLSVFPALSQVRCGRQYTTPMNEERDTCEFARVRSTEAANEL